MQTNINIIKQQKPLRNKSEDTRQRDKNKQKRERKLSRNEKRFFAFA